MATVSSLVLKMATTAPMSSDIDPLGAGMGDTPSDGIVVRGARRGPPRLDMPPDWTAM
jgi:hypothetical protein